MRLAIVGCLLLSAVAAQAQDGLRLQAIAEGEGAAPGVLLLDLPLAAIETVGQEEDEDGSWTVTVWLRGSHAADLARVTAAVVGQRVAVVHRGRVISSPRVESAVPNGLVMIPGLASADALDLAERLRGERDPRAVGGAPTDPQLRPGPVAHPEPPPAGGTLPVYTGSPRSPDPGPGRLQADGAAEAAALAFVTAIDRRAWTDAADHLHPDAHAALRPDALGLLHLDGPTVWVRDGLNEGRFALASVLTGVRATSLDALPARDLTALYLAGLDALGVWGAPSPPRAAIGEVRDGEAAHVILRADGGVEAGASTVTVVTLRRDGAGAWRALLTDARGF